MYRRLTHIALLACGLLVLLGTWRDARAQTDFFSSSPGALAKEHAALDNQQSCDKCHINNTKNIDSDKCLDCHDHNDLRKRIRAGKGYHATSKIKGKPCADCHLDHKGRGFDMMGWRTVKGQEKGFDHKLGGWELKDKHKVLECKDCHKKKNKAGRRLYLGEDKNCGSCHKRDQPHGFDRKALLKCERCHTEVSWEPPKSRLQFDHNKKSDAEFPQEGAHKDVSCGKCHPKAQFNLKRAKPGNCGNSGCHRSPHKDHLFDKKSCDWCHSPKNRSLKKFEFNHRARTKFDLSGGHSKLTCYKCHTKKLATRKPNPACAQCHSDDNPHRDRFKFLGNPPACQNCHPESSWKPTRFTEKHGKKTAFKLEGKHKTGCRKCHKGSKPYDFLNVSVATKKGKACMGCHEHKNVHNGNFTDKPKRQKVMRDGKRVQTCLECHDMGKKDPSSNKPDIDVHAKNGDWPLVAKHKGVKCVKCHKDDEFVDTPKQCGVRCHDDSLHLGNLGDECDRCHEPGRWPAVRFDHTDDTEWPLLGLHNRVAECVQCHPNQKFKNTPTNCAAVGCHAKDDAHRGRLGKKCESCHLETGENIFDHNTQSDYKLTGKHLTVRCSDCHPSVTFKPRPKDCYGGGSCHPEPEVHKGQFGTGCATCHTTESFTDIVALHDVGDFQLKGAHDQQTCDRCHIDNRRLAGSGNLCINCHRQDDIHSNSLSPRCGTCHNQWAFAPAQFNHSKVGCNLNGQHRTLPCYDCHQAGNFGGTSPLCYSCHKVDAITPEAIALDMGHPAYTACANCHKPTSWRPAGGGMGSQRESICR
jgi:hypothetical protein